MNQPLATAVPAQLVLPKVAVFIDYWNFQLGCNEYEAGKRGIDPRIGNVRAKLNWRDVGEILCKKATSLINIPTFQYEGTFIYSSYDPQTANRSYHRWFTDLNKFPGIEAKCLERKKKEPPVCSNCHRPISKCPHTGCGKDMIGTIEKGVDALIVTDMIRLAWDQGYDIAILASSDRDMIPATTFLKARAKKIIHAGFPPKGQDLSKSCWAALDLNKCADELYREAAEIIP